MDPLDKGIWAAWTAVLSMTPAMIPAMILATIAPMSMAVADCPAMAQEAPDPDSPGAILPRVQEQGRHELLVDGQQYRVLGAQVSNDQTDWGLNFTSVAQVLRVRLATY